MIPVSSLSKVAAALALTVLVAACDKPAPPAPTAPVAPPPAAAAPVAAFELQVIDWGPREAKVGEVPNKQPDGGMGIWIKVGPTKGLGDAQLLVGELPVPQTVVADELITASVPPAMIAAPGPRAIAVKQLSSQKVFAVGNLSVTN